VWYRAVSGLAEGKAFRCWLKEPWTPCVSAKLAGCAQYRAARFDSSRWFPVGITKGDVDFKNLLRVQGAYLCGGEERKIYRTVGEE